MWLSRQGQDLLILFQQLGPSLCTSRGHPPVHGLTTAEKKVAGRPVSSTPGALSLPS